MFTGDFSVTKNFATVLSTRSWDMENVDGVIVINPEQYRKHYLAYRLRFVCIQLTAYFGNESDMVFNLALQSVGNGTVDGHFYRLKQWRRRIADEYTTS